MKIDRKLNQLKDMAIVWHVELKKKIDSEPLAFASMVACRIRFYTSEFKVVRMRVMRKVSDGLNRRVKDGGNYGKKKVTDERNTSSLIDR